MEMIWAWGPDFVFERAGPIWKQSSGAGFGGPTNYLALSHVAVSGLATEEYGAPRPMPGLCLQVAHC